MGEHEGIRDRRRNRVHRALIVGGATLIAAAGAWQLNATLWTNHARSGGAALVGRFRHALANQSGAVDRLRPCGSSATGPVQGLLLVPALGVTAPVEEGIDDPQLNVAVGHLPTSVEPGSPGTSVLEAHDVSYFVNLASLKSGDRVVYETPCRTYTFQVQDKAVVQQGAPVYNTSTPSLALITCWPTDALWFTPQRYVVTTSEVSSAPTGTPLSYQPLAAPPVLPAPAALASEGLTLATNSIPMGTLTLSGSPDAAWAQSTGPLLAEDAAVSGFIGGIKSLTQNELGWWAAIAPGVAPPTPLVRAQAPRYDSPLNVEIAGRGASATTVSLATTVTVSGGTQPGRYALSVAEAVQGSKIVISNWVVRPA